MVTFMPTFAFAASPKVGPDPNNHEGWDNWTKDVNASTAGTCTEYGVDVYNCKGVRLWDEENNRFYKDANEDDLYIECNGVKKVLAGPGHDYARTQVKKAEMNELFAQLASRQHWSAQRIAAMAKVLDGICYVYINKCTQCGAIDWITFEEELVKFTDERDETVSKDIIPHKTPAEVGEPDCVPEYTCTGCGETRKWNADKYGVNEDVPGTEKSGTHRWKDLEGKNAGYACAGTIGTMQVRVPLVEFECVDCGLKVVRPDTSDLNGEELAALNHRNLGTPAYTTEQFNALTPANQEMVQNFYVEYKGNFYEPNKIMPDSNATCLNDSTNNPGYLECPDCGMTLGNRVQVKATGHKEAKFTTAATCDYAGYEVTWCTECGQNLASKKVAEPTGHDYDIKVLAGATVYDDGITLITCKNCGNIATNRANTPVWREGKVVYVRGEGKEKDIIAKYGWNYDMVWGKPGEGGQIIPLASVMNSKYDYNPTKEKYEPVGDWYFIGFNQEFLTKPADDWKTTDYAEPPISSKAVKLADWHQLEMKLGPYEDMAPATCYTPLLQAQKDSVSGDWDVHSLQVIGKPLGHDLKTYNVEPTCGSIGYSYDTCSRCKEIVKNTSAKDAQRVFFPETYDFEWVYNVVQPVVSEGTPCTFEWKVIKEATADEDGIKALVCTVCNTVQKGSETVIPADKDAKKDQAIAAATPTIEAAAAITGNASKYTADSVKAVEEAKTNLNTAMATGTAADVTRMAAELQKAVDNAQLKAANTMTAKGKTITAKKNKTKTFKKSKAFSVKSAKGKVTFAKKSGKAKIVVSKSGKVTVKKGLKKGTYKVKVAVTAAGNGNYLPKTKVVTLKVKVK
jgi:hypothetical protein